MHAYKMVILHAAYVFQSHQSHDCVKDVQALGTREYRYMYVSLPLKDEQLALHHV